MEAEPGTNHKGYLVKAVEIAIRIAMLVFIIGWCISIVKPFLSIMVWAIIIAVALYPAFKKLSRIFGGREKISAILITSILLSIIILPSVLLTKSLVQSLAQLKGTIESGKSFIPPPGDRVNSWPSIAKPIAQAWESASQSLDSAIKQYRPQLRSAGAWLLTALAGIGMGILQLIVSTIIAGILLVYATEGNIATNKIFVRLAGKNGEKFAYISKVTIIQVVKGILGVAIIQALMAGIGFWVAGVPAAGLLTVICLIFFIVQVGAGLVIIPTMIYMFSVTDTLAASLFAGWMVITLLASNVLTPIMLGRGAPVPMLVIFLGSIGGFISMGFIGLFLGAVVLSIAYNLYLFWLTDESNEKTFTAMHITDTIPEN
jgi:predicted PurR-regulated permease PerM